MPHKKGSDIPSLKFHPHADGGDNAPEGGNLEGPPWNSAYCNQVSTCPVALTMLHSASPSPTTYRVRFISFLKWTTKDFKKNPPELNIGLPTCQPHLPPKSPSELSISVHSITHHPGRNLVMLRAHCYWAPCADVRNMPLHQSMR